MTAPTTCIYCSQPTPANSFTREHVIPQLLGTFQNNLTLTHAVCGTCNQFFGVELEPTMAYGTYEALRRLELGIRPPERVAKLMQERVRFTLTSHGIWNGAILRLKQEGGHLVVVPAYQVGFTRRSGQGMVFISEESLEDQSVPIPEDVDPAQGILLVCDSDAAQERLIRLLEHRGVKFEEKARVDPPPADNEMLPVDIQVRIDELVQRCVGKIAFNYLARRYGVDHARHANFDTIRSFVRYGNAPNYPLVVVDQEPILATDQVLRRQTNGHLVTVSWASDGRSILGQVSLFNELRYRICLARDCDGGRRDIGSGHHFDIETRQITALGMERK